MSQPQYMDALARANEVRLGRAHARHEVLLGALSVADALYVECCQTMRVIDLLMAQRRWGISRSRKVLGIVGLSEAKRVADLTGRQRRALIAAVGGRRTAA